jgi:TetR/AcrR family transcriptional regulator, transcriptional repressor for nem operon
MAKPSHREKLLHVGMRVVHERGFGGASVRDIVRAAGVPQGSFTNHFTSKEAFGLEVIDLYFADACEQLRQTLRNDALPPLQRLRAWIDGGKDRLARDGMRNGCLFGNFTAECNDCGEAIRARLVAVFAELQSAIAACLRAAVAAGEIAPATDCDQVAWFTLAGLQGALLLAKARRSPLPVEHFEAVLFASVLRRTGPG